MKTTINETVAQLDGLYKGYEGVLSEAKRQLASLGEYEMKGDDYAALASHITSNQAANRSFCAELSKKMLEGLTSDAAVLEAFVDAIASRVRDQLLSQLNDELQQRVEAVLQSADVDRMISDRLKANEEVTAAMDVTAAFDTAVKRLVERWSDEETGS